MRAAVLHHPAPIEHAPLRIEDRDDPPPAAGEVVVAVSACAVCRTDLQLCEGDLAPHRLPLVPGHQAVGRVVAAGADAAAVRVGDRVGVAWLAGTCGTCRFCRSQRENLCEQAIFTGWDRDGGFATRLTARADFVYRLPEGYDDEAAAPLLCGGAIGYRCLRVANVSAGARIGLFGFGASATIVLQLARFLGCDVYVITRSTAEQDRARQLGAVWTGSYDDRPPLALDAAITFAPAGSVVVRALETVDRGAPVIVNAIHLDGIPAFDYSSLWWERSIRSVANLTRADVIDLLALAPRVPVITQRDRYPLPDANLALVDLRAGRVRGAAVLEM